MKNNPKKTGLQIPPPLQIVASTNNSAGIITSSKTAQEKPPLFGNFFPIEGWLRDRHKNPITWKQLQEMREDGVHAEIAVSGRHSANALPHDIHILTSIRTTSIRYKIDCFFTRSYCQWCYM